jgi:hypothetical protein
MGEQTESLAELRFASELRDGFERVIEGEVAGRTPRARSGRLARGRWLPLATACLCCLIGALLASTYVDRPHPQAVHGLERQPFSPATPCSIPRRRAPRILS